MYDEEPKFVDSWDGVGEDVEWPRKSIWLRECALVPVGKGGKDGDIHIQKPQSGAFGTSNKVYKVRLQTTLATRNLIHRLFVDASLQSSKPLMLWLGKKHLNPS